MRCYSNRNMTAFLNDDTEFVGAQPEPQFVGYVAHAAGLQDASPTAE